jgi:hypothetical protein
MEPSRRFFLKRLMGAMAMTLAGTQLVGCLGNGSDSSQASGGEVQSSASSAPADAPVTPASPAPSAPSQMAANSAPVWQPAPTIEFVEGVPTVIDVRQFVLDPDKDPLIITLKSGTLLPGITWNPNTYAIAYDGRPLGAKPDAPVVLTGITFSADDQQQ